MVLGFVTTLLMSLAVPDVYDADPVFSAARGAAEFARRGGFLWNYGCVHEASEANPLSWRKA